MIFLIIGIAVMVMTGFVSQSFYTRAEAEHRIIPGRVFGGAVPSWVSLINLTSFGCALYGLYKITF
jgi:enterochelin esterase-like enzyme